MHSKTAASGFLDCLRPNRDPKIRERLDANAYLVQQVARRMARGVPPNVLLDDLISAGTLGLLAAIEAWTGEGEWKLYARYRIKFYILDELRRQDWLTRRQRKQGASSRAWESEQLLASMVVQPPESFEHEELAQAVAELPTAWRIVAEAYAYDEPAHVTARRLGISQPRVSQLRAKAFRQLRELLTGEPRTRRG